MTSQHLVRTEASSPESPGQVKGTFSPLTLHSLSPVHGSMKRYGEMREEIEQTIFSGLTLNDAEPGARRNSENNPEILVASSRISSTSPGNITDRFGWEGWETENQEPRWFKMAHGWRLTTERANGGMEIQT